METMVRHNGSSAATIALPEPERAKARNIYEVVAGALLSITGIGIILSIITNEALYPVARHYSTFANTISDLGGTEPPNSYMVQPNRLMFIVTMAIASVLVLTATYLLGRVIERRRFIVALRHLRRRPPWDRRVPGERRDRSTRGSRSCASSEARSRPSCRGRSWKRRCATSRWCWGRWRCSPRCSASSRWRTGDRKRRSASAGSSGGSPTRSCCGSSYSALLS